MPHDEFEPGDRVASPTGRQGLVVECPVEDTELTHYSWVCWDDKVYDQPRLIRKEVLKHA